MYEIYEKKMAGNCFCKSGLLGLFWNPNPTYNFKLGTQNYLREIWSTVDPLNGVGLYRVQIHTIWLLHL